MIIKTKKTKFQIDKEKYIKNAITKRREANKRKNANRRKIK